ncbi:helix-turn-helix domain-containing protein [Secundilactobacillus mixtipabuli]|uniref:helix-turn-helix domain-containing protein n=1 Tax=Secundilactobacillus mixtipabuli TaxID=1435342 RepID=UPI001CDB070D|nr:AraC family transcriptional regulator [Secundilactobacillus mixtipabuli]
MSELLNKMSLPIDGTLTQDIVCYHNQDSQHDSPLHQHSNHFELYLFISGDVTFFTDNAAYSMRRGYLVAIPPHRWHRSFTNGKTTYDRIFLNIRTNLVSELSSDLTDLSSCFQTNQDQEVSILKLTANELNHFIDLSHELITVLRSNNYGSDIQRKIILSQILLLANTAGNAQNSEKDNIIPIQLQQMIDFIDVNLANNLSLSSFSRQFFMSATYLNRYFKRYMGLSLHNYIIEKRIELAKQLLFDGETVANTCDQCGFGNYSNFIRSFTNHVGISPGRYGKKIH